MVVVVLVVLESGLVGASGDDGGDVGSHKVSIKQTFNINMKMNATFFL